MLSPERRPVGGAGSSQAAPPGIRLPAGCPICLTALLYWAALGQWLFLSEQGFDFRKTGMRMGRDSWLCALRSSGWDSLSCVLAWLRTNGLSRWVLFSAGDS